MSHAELVLWSHYYQLEPWGHESNRLNLARLQSTIANFSGNASKHLNPSDFLPKPPQQLTPQILKAMLGG